jgi:hypothetical protein
VSAAPETGDLTRWWTSLVTAALVGTGRTQPPPLPELGTRARDDATAEVALLDAAAIGGVLRAAGRPTPGGADPGGACPPDVAPAAPERAVQILQLTLDQPPVSRELQGALLAHVFRRASEHGRRLPHELLPIALGTATVRPELRAPLMRVLDERGRWLAARRPEWTWVHAEGRDEALTDDGWLHLPATEQPAGLRRIRAVDPARGLALAEQALPSLGAKQRAALLESLSVGLGAADEPLLEVALDDRAATVRSAACALLDGLPGSERAGRMATRLRPALSVGGLLRKSLTVAALPEPDDTARRDGIGDAPSGALRQAWYLEQMVAGAPLSVLTEVTGTDPAGVLGLDREGALWPGLLRAVTTRRDSAWARGMLEQFWDAGLVAALAPDEREVVARRALRSSGADPAAAAILAAVPGSWGPELSLATAEWVTRVIGTASRPAPLPLDIAVAARLHPAALPALRRSLATCEAAEADAARTVALRPPTATPPRPDPDAARLATARHNVRILRDAAQYLSLIGLVDEAFT